MLSLLQLYGSPWRFCPPSLPITCVSRWLSLRSASAWRRGLWRNTSSAPDSLGPGVDWLRFLATTGAVVLTFLAGAELEPRERWYHTLLMSTGLTFGTISALYGFSHGIITREQYSFLVAVVIGSAVVPTLIASYAFFPRHLLAQAPVPDEEMPQLGEPPLSPAENNGNGLGDE